MPAGPTQKRSTRKGRTERGAARKTQRRPPNPEWILEALPTAIIAVDPNYTVRYVNPAAAAALSRDPCECVGQKCHSLLRSGHCNTPECCVARAIRTESVSRSDTTANLPSGEMPIRCTAVPLKNSRGKIVGALECVADMSEEQACATEITSLAECVVDGNLSVRGDPDQYTVSAFAQIVLRVNEALDAAVQPIREAADVLGKAARGDLTGAMVGDYKADHAAIKTHLNATIDSLQQIIASVAKAARAVAATSRQTMASAQEAATSADQIARASGEVTNAAQETAKVAEQAAKTMNELTAQIVTTDECASRVLGLTETCAEVMQGVEAAADQVANASEMQAAAVHQASAAVKENIEGVQLVARASQAAAHCAQSAAEFARRGNESGRQTSEGLAAIKGAVTQTSEQIRELNHRSEQIGRIVETIDGIAEQTNLLALNAAIEAARAGEHGRGFAVVADEVRKLAERSQQATGEIAELISGLQKDTRGVVASMEDADNRIEEGEKLVAATTKCLDDILEAVQNVSSQLQDISSSSEQVNAGMVEVDKVYDQIASLSQGNAAAAQELSASSHELTQSIGSIAESSRQASVTSQRLKASAEDMNNVVADVAAIGQETAANAQASTSAVDQQAQSVLELAKAAQELAGLAQTMQEQLAQFTISDSASSFAQADTESERRAAA